MSKIEKITPQIAALYLGAKCEYPGNEGNKTFAILSGVASDGIETTFKRKKNGVCGDIIGWEQRSPNQKCFAGALVLHLRRLDSITEQEAKELFFQYCAKRYEDVYTDDDALGCWWNMTEEWSNYLNTLAIGEPAVWLWLLSKGFDLFGLIEAGLAKEIKPETANA